MGEFEEQVTVSAPREKVWDVLADIGNIYSWNPGVVHSEQTTPGEVGMGACRQCNLGGKNYLDEKVVEFERPHKLTIRITDTNLPFKTADIRFSLESHGDGTIVKVSPKYQLKFGWLGPPRAGNPRVFSFRADRIAHRGQIRAPIPNLV